MPAPDRAVVARLKADVDRLDQAARLRELGGKIREATRAASDLRRRYELLGNTDIPELIKARQDLLGWTVRRQVLIECWELLTGKVWVSGLKSE